MVLTAIFPLLVIGSRLLKMMSKVVPHVFCVFCFSPTEQLEGVSISHVSVSVQPRGLINQGNWCYIHAVSFVSVGDRMTGRRVGREGEEREEREQKERREGPGSGGSEKGGEG